MGARRATPSHLGGFTSKSNKCATKIDEAQQVLKVLLALISSLKLNQTLIALTKRGVRESSQMAWNELGVKWQPAASPGGVGWVYIATPHKLAVAVQKLVVMTCTGAALPLRPAALP
jgi:hypothetical protein